MPVVVPCAASTDTVNAVRCASVFSADHQRQLQLVEPLALDRQADHAARVADHERHRLGRDLLGRHDEVALVLAVLVVDDDDDLAARDRGDGVLDVLSNVMSAASWLGLRSSSRSTYLASDVDFEVDADRRAARRRAS